MEAIDARIVRVDREADGTATIFLDPRDGHYGGWQTVLVVLDPPEFFEACVGTAVWSRGRSLMVGRRTWAERLGEDRLRLVTKE